jgi:hypothetical protein
MRTRLKSVKEGTEMGLSPQQCDFLRKEMKMEGVYHPSAERYRYGYIAFEAPKYGYYSIIDERVWKTLLGYAKKSDTSVYLDFSSMEIRFYANTHTI